MKNDTKEKSSEKQTQKVMTLKWKMPRRIDKKFKRKEWMDKGNVKIIYKTMKDQKLEGIEYGKEKN